MGNCYVKDNLNLKKKIPFKKEDSIAIIGAGASGIHMAHLLYKKGYKNIQIYEQ